MNMVAYVDVVLSASLGSPQHWQKMNSSSFHPGMLGTGLGIGPLTLLQELHSSVFCVVPTEILESVVRSCPVMH